MEDASNDFEVIDLLEYLEPENSGDSTKRTTVNQCLEDVPFFHDDDLYSHFLNGELSFDELMREMHRKEVGEDPSERGNAGSGVSSGDGSSSSDDNDPVYRPSFSATKSKQRNADPQSSGGGSRLLSSRSQRYRKRKSQLTSELSQYLGEAERFINNGELEAAEEVCRRIMEQNPLASEPYFVMAEVYYHQGQMDMSRKYLLAAAKRNPADTTKWLNLIELAEDAGDFAAAIHYTRCAIRGSKQNSDLRRRLVGYLERAGLNRQALNCRLNALIMTPEESGDAQFKAARQLADVIGYSDCFSHYTSNVSTLTLVSIMLPFLQHEVFYGKLA